MDLLILWEWAGDEPFVQCLMTYARNMGARAEAVWGADMAPRLRVLDLQGVRPALVLDRASDVVPEAARFVARAKARGLWIVNDPNRMAAARDKARMHLALMSAGVQVPWTLLLPPRKEITARTVEVLAHVGTPFVIKPAHGGGGEGVVMGASTTEEIARVRTGMTDTVLIQEHIRPATIQGHPAWFRVLRCLDETFPCFWRPATREYTPLTAAERATAWGERIERTASGIAGVCGMDLFSTEVALTEAGRLVAVDYVNDMCDLRPASHARDGVPDSIVEAVARRIVNAAVAADGERNGHRSCGPRPT